MRILRAEWPFTFVVDSAGQGTGWVVINSHIVSPRRQAQFSDLRRAGLRFLGMSSDGTFPSGAETDLLDYGAVCEAWCHCFREPERFVPAHLPRALISESDFTDYQRISRDVVQDSETADFIYVGAGESWKRVAKNWDLAMRCMPRLCGALGLRGVVVGGPADELPHVASLVYEPLLPWREFLVRLAHARFLFLPNEGDASPRVLTEALCLDVPVVVNRRILGGWKYVNAFTGVFFDDESDVQAAAVSCTSERRSPREWFMANHGPYHAGRRLLRLLGSLDARITERSHLGLARSIEERPERTL